MPKCAKPGLFRSDLHYLKVLYLKVRVVPTHSTLGLHNKNTVEKESLNERTHGTRRRGIATLSAPQTAHNKNNIQPDCSPYEYSISSEL